MEGRRILKFEVGLKRSKKERCKVARQKWGTSEFDYRPRVNDNVSTEMHVKYNSCKIPVYMVRLNFIERSKETAGNKCVLENKLD